MNCACVNSEIVFSIFSKMEMKAFEKHFELAKKHPEFCDEFCPVYALYKQIMKNGKRIDDEEFESESLNSEDTCSSESSVHESDDDTCPSEFSVV